MKTIQRIIILFATIGTGLTGCGSDGGSAACSGYCDKQGTATGCSGSLDDVVSMCKQLCDALASQLSADCAAKGDAQYTCLAKQSWKCSTGGNLPQPEDPQACAAQTAAFAPCLQQR